MGASVDFPNSLFQSIDTIISARIANLPYDQTVECDIIDNSKASTGEYTVQYQNAKFQAYTENTSFAIGDRVYVQVPKGDYNQDKIIISKKKSEETTEVSKLPFSSFAREQFYSSKNEYNFFTSKETQKTLILQQSWLSSNYQAGYNYLGIKFAISSGIADTVTSGSYGLQIDILGYDQSGAVTKGYQAGRAVVKTYYFTPDDMIGANPFNTVGYINQTKLYDIKNLVISGINIYFIQTEPIIGSSKGTIVNSRIRLSNISLYFGYNVSEFKKSRQLFLYTADGLQYNDDYRVKTLKYHYYELQDDNTIKVPGDINNIELYWGQYDQNSSAILSDYNWLQGYTLNIKTDYISSRDMTMSANRSLLSESFILSLKNTNTDEMYTSNVLTFTNALYIEGSELLDILTGFQVNVTQDDYNGVYNIYGQDYLAIDPTAVAVPHYFILNYYPSSGDTAGMQVDDIITWKIPYERTMIKNVAMDGITRQISEADQTYIYTKTLTANDIETNGIYRLPYYIENYYSSNYTNNTVSFTLARGGMTYTASKELLFSTAGSQGNEYNVVMRLQQNGVDVPAIMAGQSSTYQIVIDIYNYNNEKISTENITNLEYDYILNNSNFVTSKVNNSFTTSAININNNYYFVIKISFSIGSRNLEAYKPIAIRLSDEYTAINGSTVITYDITGKKPLYNKLQFQISDKNAIVTDVKWSIIPNPDRTKGEPVFDGEELIPPSIYQPTDKQFTLVCNTKDDIIIWKQPICMIQNKYPGAMVNGEGNAYTITDGDKDGTSVFSAPMLGSFNNNTSGLYLGEVTDLNQNKKIALITYGDGVKACEIDNKGYVYLNGISDEYKVIINNAQLSNVLIDKVSFTNDTVFTAATANYAMSAGSARNATTANYAVNATHATTAAHATTATTANNYNTNTGNIKDALQKILARLDALDGKGTTL